MKRLALYLIIFALFSPLGNAQDTLSDPTYLRLWADNVPFPKKSEIPFPEGVSHRVVQDGNLEPEYKFMHETAIGFCDNELFFGWYNNPELELQGKTIQRVRRSLDNGETWTEPELVMDRDSLGEMCVGLQFFSLDGNFYLLSNLESEAERPIHCLLSRYDRTNRDWDPVAPIAERFLAMQAPVQNERGDYVASGSFAPLPGQIFASTPAALVSRGNDVDKTWRLIRLDSNDQVNVFAETSVIVEGKNALAVTRREDSPFPNFYESIDYGENWRRVENKSFPAVHSKFAAGIFSDGTRYIAFNLPEFERESDGSFNRDSFDYSSRDSLAIAVASKGESAFSRAYMISNPETPCRLAESHYPCVVERDGWVYVSYTGKYVDKPLRVGALTKFPLEALRK